MDFVRGAAVAAGTSVVALLIGIVGPHFDIFTVDWAAVGHSMVNAAFYGFVGYVGKRLMTDESGKLFGRL